MTAWEAEEPLDTCIPYARNTEANIRYFCCNDILWWQFETCDQDLVTFP